MGTPNEHPRQIEIVDDGIKWEQRQSLCNVVVGIGLVLFLLSDGLMCLQIRMMLLNSLAGVVSCKFMNLSVLLCIILKMKNIRKCILNYYV